MPVCDTPELMFFHWLLNRTQCVYWLSWTVQWTWWTAGRAALVCNLFVCFSQIVKDQSTSQCQRYTTHTVLGRAEFVLGVQVYVCLLCVLIRWGCVRCKCEGNSWSSNVMDTLVLYIMCLIHLPHVYIVHTVCLSSNDDNTPGQSQLRDGCSWVSNGEFFCTVCTVSGVLHVCVCGILVVLYECELVDLLSSCVNKLGWECK